MKKLIIIFLLILFFININLEAQISVIDSIKTEIDKMPDDSLKVKKLIRLSNKYLGLDLKQAILFSRQAFTIARKINNKKLETRAYYFASVAYATSGNADSCFYYAKLGEDLAIHEKDYKNLSDIYSLYVTVFQALSDNENAMKYGFMNIKLMEKLKRYNQLGYAYTDLANLYMEKHDSSNAMKFYLKAFENYKLAKNNLQAGNAFQSLGLLNYEKFDSVEARSYYLKTIEEFGKDNYKSFYAYIGLSWVCKPKERIKYLEKAKTLAIKNKKYRSLPYLLMSIGKYYMDTDKNIALAKGYFKNGLDVENKIGDFTYRHELLSNMANAYIESGPIDSAIFFINKSMTTSKNIGMDKVVQENYLKLYKLYKKLPNADSALHYLELSNSIKDSLYNAGISQKNAEANAKYETEKKEAEITRQKLQVVLEKKRKNRILFGGITLLLISGLGFQWFVNRQRRKNKETELALKFKKAESKNLMELNDAKSRFFANITHEFRTPLTLIMGPLQDAIGKVKGDTKETLIIAHSNSKKLLTLVNDILDLSTIEEGSLELNKSNTCLFDFLKRIFYSYESYAKVRQIHTEILLPERNDILINTDLEKLEKIINNLLSNAFKYTEIGGTIKMIIDIKDNDAFISIQDTGVGIDEKDIKHIFDRYYQGQNAENITGTGIGLSFADKLAKIMGGNISVESIKNEGSTFTLQLPIGNSKECPDDLKIADVQEQTSGVLSSSYKVKAIFDDKPKVLIVEDNYEMQKYLSSIMKEYFYIEIADNGFEGLKKLKENKYDLISSDVMMPGMDGFIFRQEINKNPKWRNLPFILLTARSLKEDKLRGFKLGVDDYITKPFNAVEYIARINNLIKNKLERDKWINEKISTNDFNQEKQEENELINKMEKMILQNIDNPDFNVSVLATNIGYSQRNLSRITKKLIGMTPVNLILEVRLQKAYQLLKSNRYKTISEVRYEVGIDNASYFTRKFVERYGVKPGEVR